MSANLTDPPPRVSIDLTQMLADVPSRLARIESDVNHLKGDVAEIKTGIKELRIEARTDFRLLFGALIAVAVGLAGMMAKGFHWI